MNPQTIHPIILSFPDWFYAVISIALGCGVFYLGGLHRDIKKICEKFPRVEEALVRISQILVAQKFVDDYLYSMSPLRLTEKGLQLMRDIQFDEFFEANKKILIDRVKSKNPKSLADLEEACRGVMLLIEGDLPKFESIKNYAFQNGRPLATILSPCGIALRDKLKEEFEFKP